MTISPCYCAGSESNDRVAVIVCVAPGGSLTALPRMLLASTQAMVCHSWSPRSASAAAPSFHGFQTTVVWELSLVVRIVRPSEGSIRAI